MFINYNNSFSITDPPSWGPWGPWGDCECTEGLGEQTRNRLCDDPLPDDEEECLGNAEETLFCDDQCSSE